MAIYSHKDLFTCPSCKKTVSPDTFKVKWRAGSDFQSPAEVQTCDCGYEFKGEKCELCGKILFPGTGISVVRGSSHWSNHHSCHEHVLSFLKGEGSQQGCGLVASAVLISSLVVVVAWRLV